MDTLPLSNNILHIYFEDFANVQVLFHFPHLSCLPRSVPTGDTFSLIADDDCATQAYGLLDQPTVTYDLQGDDQDDDSGKLLFIFRF